MYLPTLVRVYAISAHARVNICNLAAGIAFLDCTYLEQNHILSTNIILSADQPINKFG